MNEEQQIKVQAFCDGELPEAETRAVASWLAQDAEATALLGELKHTRRALANFERAVNVPESREFYWSKIAREIEQAEPVVTERPRHPLFSFWRRTFAVAAGFGALALALLFVNLSGRHPAAADLETAMTDAGAFTYRNYESGTTLVWLSYPADNDIAAGQPATTIQ